MRQSVSIMRSQRLIIEDIGRGFDVQKNTTGFGLHRTLALHFRSNTQKSC
ncbi:hypothetical protein [Anabaena sp. UHCC 0253]|nr:hypothetical protein [Anabaena sp. UHCC 0253]